MTENSTSGTAAAKVKEIRMNLRDKFQHQENAAKIDHNPRKYDPPKNANQIAEYQNLNQVQDLGQDEANINNNSDRSFENEDEEDIINNDSNQLIVG